VISAPRDRSWSFGHVLGHKAWQTNFQALRAPLPSPVPLRLASFYFCTRCVVLHGPSLQVALPEAQEANNVRVKLAANWGVWPAAGQQAQN